jgi:hypothetical protein
MMARRPRPARDRTCPWPGCHKPIRAAYLMCRAHWYRLPEGIRGRITATYRRGQTLETASPGYREALHDALDYACHAAAAERLHNLAADHIDVLGELGDQADAPAPAIEDAARVIEDAYPAAALEQLGAKWSPDFGAYASGELDASKVRCVLCGKAPCECPPFGSPEYFALLDRLHGRNRGQE